MFADNEDLIAWLITVPIHFNERFEEFIIFDNVKFVADRTVR